MDIDSGEYSYGDSISKTVPAVCEDGSTVSCTYYPTGTGRRYLIRSIEFKQVLSGEANETVYLEQLLAFVMDEFATKMTENEDESFEPVTSETYNGALRVCREFIDGKDAEKSICISPEQSNEFAVDFERKTDEKTTLSVRFHLWNR